MKLLNVFLFLLLVFCLATPVYGESVIYGYQPDPIHFTETGNSYILSNSEMEVEFFTGSAGYNQYKNARNNEVLIYNSRVWVDYLGPGSKWKQAGIAQSVSYRQIPKGYEVTRHYTGIQANYDVIYTWVENRPLKYAVDITAGTAETFQVSWALDGVPNSRMIDKNIVSGDSNELVISIQDVISSFGDDAVAVSESSSANGMKWDYTFGTWDLDLSNVSNNTHKVQVDPSIEFNGTDNWVGTSGTMLEHGDGNLRNPPNNTDGLISYYSFEAGAGNIAYDVYNSNDGTFTDGVTGNWTTSGKFGSAWTGDGVNDYINVGNPINLQNFSEMSFGGWIKNNGADIQRTRAGIIFKSDFYESDGYGLMLYDGSGARFFLNGVIFNPGLISKTELTLYMLTWDGNNVNIYVNGNKVLGPVAYTSNISTTSGLLTFGKNAARHTYFNGTIDGVRIYDRALSNDEINESYANYHTLTSYLQTDTPQNATTGQVWAHINTSGTDSSTNTTASLWINGSDDNATFNGWEQVNASFNIGDNVSIGLAYQYQYATFKIYSNTTYQPETNIISSFTLISGEAPPSMAAFTSTTPATPYHSLPNTSVTFTGTVDQTGNFTWFFNGSIVQYNNSTSTATYINNSSVVGGPYNITLVFTNVNGTVQYTWAWHVTESIHVPMSLFMLMGFLVLISLFASMITTGVPAICMSILGSMIAFINSQIAINGQLVENIGGVASDGTVLQGTMTYELPALSYLFIFVGLIMIGLTIYHISQEIQYRKDNNYTEVDF